MSLRTIKILTGLFLAIAFGGLGWLAFVKIKAQREQAKITEAKDHVRQRRSFESNAVIAKVEARRGVDETVHATPVDLSAYINSPLDNSFVPKSAKDNNLSELGEGLQTLAGVPFSIKGAIQLHGNDLRSFSKASFPREVSGIQVAATCEKIHILHGSYFVKQLGLPIAKLVLHYANGATGEISIVTGQHVLDWWAPNYGTGVKKNWRDVSAPGSELAWVGSNPYIKRKQPNLSLRLFKSSFQNPQPTAQLMTIDYVSTLSQSAPFLVGLTVE